ncbi:MAG: LysR substrate-binding domain-containing protein [Gammaproteobacteria bacterium]|nr:LysR substrate-binding domain-containing protein [Gammaproteobacteria bacterium]
MDRYRQMQVFVAVAEEEGFAAAARRLRSSPPAVTRAIAGLEDDLGVRLFDRSTRYVRPTDAGLRYLDDARRILDDIAAAEDSVAGINAEPRGELAVTAPVLFGRLFVMPAIVDYLERFPQVQVSAVLLDRVVNLLEEGLDVGVRIGELPDSSMRALRVGAVRQVLVAAPDYLARHGRLAHPDDLENHTLIASSAGSMAPGWRFLDHGEQLITRPRPRLVVTTNDAAIEAARVGFGIAHLMSYQVAACVAAGELEILLPKFEPPPNPVHILHRESRHGSPKVRSFIDALAERLKAEPALH